MEDSHKYDDIIHMEHPTSKRHPPMDAINRAAQFAPFKALTGLEDEIEDTAILQEQNILNSIQREADGEYLEYLEKEKGGFSSF